MSNDFIVPGFRFSAVAAEIRYQGRLDLGLIFCDRPAVTAGVFTTNLAKAAPVLLDMERLPGGQGTCRAVLVNSGNANAATGQAGMDAARSTAQAAARVLGIAAEEVLVASTGVIGCPLPAARIETALPALVAGLAPERAADLNQAIMTTDSFPKTACRTLTLPGGDIRLVAVCKGAGMIMPDMATMLCFVVTDATIRAPLLADALRDAVDNSFNRITVDGDTSTNDTVLLLASGASPVPELLAGTTEFLLFRDALAGMLLDLARMIVQDGEGATKVVTIRVRGAVSPGEAQMAARTIANSPLVKTAFFGQDPNWGRILAAAGRSGARFDPDRLRISFDRVCLVEGGVLKDESLEKKAAAVMRQKEFCVTVDLGAGAGEASIITCDLSLDYVKINADYRS